MMFYGQTVSAFYMLRLPLFYIDFVESFVIAFILINIVHVVTILLDRRYSWNEHWVVRIVWQLLLAWALPCLAAYFLAMLYFYLQHIDIEKTDYLLMELPDIAIMLLLFNIYYFLHYLIVTLRNKAKEKRGYPELLAIYNSDHVSLNVVDQVAFFYTNGNGYSVRTFKTSNPKTYIIKLNLKEIESFYSGKDFFRINRQTIVNRKIVAGVDTAIKGNAMLIFKDEWKTKIDFSPASLFIVSKDRLTAFKRWVQQ